MPNLTALIGHWGYWAILLMLLAGNFGVPVPEETVLILSGYLVWKKKLWLPAVLTIAILSAIAGDNLGYWVGRRYGSTVIDRYGRWALTPAERFDRMRRMVIRYGPIAVFFARFLPGLRFMAGPLAGSLGMPLPKFFVPNVLGAALYVPLAVAAGYALGYGFGRWVEQFRHMVGEIEHVVMAGVIVCTLLILGSRAYRAWKKRNV
jgi:membrane protein DedA with SNARE-associated domain